MTDKYLLDASKGSVGNKKKITISYVIREREEPYNRSGVNCVQLDEENRLLYTAGRDSIIRSWKSDSCQGPENKPVQIMDDHSDWVNSIFLSNDKKVLVSAGSDAYIKIWDAMNGSVMCSVQDHKDYVTALAYASLAEKFVSVSLDRKLNIWDLSQLRAIVSKQATATSEFLRGQKNSIYSVATTPECGLVVSGSTEKMLRAWDPRTSQELMQLRGHSDNVRALALSSDGTWCVSGSSDRTLKLWSISQQRCVRTINLPDSVWTILPLGDMSQVLAGLKDGSIHWVDVKSNTTKVIVQESAAILSFCIDHKQSLLWVGTTNSCVNAWELELSAYDEAIKGHGALPAAPSPSHPVKSIPGRPRIKDVSILKDRRHVLTKDTDNEIQLWDIMFAKFVRNLGNGELEAYREEEERKMMNNLIPSWFSVRIKTGLITICIDEVGWKSAWIVASQTDLPGSESPGVKYNLGCLVLLGIFKQFTAYYKVNKENGEVEKEEKTIDTDFVTVPDHTPIVLTESDDSGIVLCRVLSKDVAETSEREKLHRMLPSWALNYLLHRDLPQQLKINFTIVPHKSIASSKTVNLFNPTGPTRLNGCDTVSIRKIIDYVYEQLHKSTPEGDRAVDTIEILCNGQVLTLDLDMRSIKYHIWKSTSDLKLEYRFKVIENGGEKGEEQVDINS